MICAELVFLKDPSVQLDTPMSNLLQWLWLVQRFGLGDLQGSLSLQPFCSICGSTILYLTIATYTKCLVERAEDGKAYSGEVKS